MHSRTHRFGQEKEVYVSRVILNNTVEQRILDLQRKKQDITDNTLGEGTGKSAYLFLVLFSSGPVMSRCKSNPPSSLTELKRMTVGELATLFNVNTRVSGICLTNHSPSSEKGFTLALD
jgi:SNF2 family DNA or RNA helicase